MKFSDLILMSIRNLWRRKLRTFLTILGVVIGTAAIVIMVSLGIAMNENFKTEIEKMGSLNVINVMSPGYWGGGMAVSQPGGQGGTATLDQKAIASFEKIPGVEIASPILDVYWKIKGTKQVAQISVRGVDLDILPALGLTLAQGVFPDKEVKMALLFGGNVTTQFYNPKSKNPWATQGQTPIDVMTEKMTMSFDYNYGEKLQPGTITNTPPKPFKVKVTGILNTGLGEHDYYVYMDINQVELIKKEQEKYDKKNNPGMQTQKTSGYPSALVKVKDMKDVADIQKTIKEMGFEAYSLTEYLDSMQKTSAGLQAILGGIGAVSLFVAAIGITNTMVMSIYERTKEIGVMKVIGASLQDIKKLFLAEAAWIGFIGGLLGMGVSALGSLILNKMGMSLMSMYYMGEGSKISSIPTWLYLSALGFTTLVGIVSGYFPAVRAMKLSVLSALRQE